MLSLRRLEHFAIIAEEKSFLKAAVRLNLTQPALTHSIQTLEESFGLQLFNRAHDGISLTDAGQRLLPSALRTLAGADSLKREAFELLSVDEALRGLIHNRASESDMHRQAQRNGLGSLREDGERLVALGLTSREELLRVTRD